MGRVYDDISEEQARWIGEQPMFFVATAAQDTHINLSPRGLDTFRVLGPRRVACLVSTRYVRGDRRTSARAPNLTRPS